MKALLVNDTFDWYHFGCTGTSTILRSKITSLGYDLQSFRISECHEVVDSPLNATEFFAADTAEKFLATNLRLSQLLANTDIVVINGEGTLHGVKKGPLTVLYIGYLAKKIFNKHVQIINHSVYPHDDLTLEDNPNLQLYLSVYKLMDYVAIREPVSLQLMRSLGLAAHESFDCLPVYIRDHYRPARITKYPKIILLSGSAAWFKLNVFIPGASPQGDVIDGLLQLIEILRSKIAQGYTIKFLQSATTNPAKDDVEMITFLKDKMGDDLQVQVATTLDEWLQTIQEAGLLISGRFHHSIAATCLGTPFVAFNSNTPKMLGLMTALGFTKPLLYSQSDLQRDIASSIAAPTICSNPAEKISELCAKAENNFAVLRAVKQPL